MITEPELPPRNITQIYHDTSCKTLERKIVTIDLTLEYWTAFTINFTISRVVVVKSFTYLYKNWDYIYKNGQRKLDMSIIHKIVVEWHCCLYA